jgi:pseudouridine-5'-phosphate glycosidase
MPYPENLETALRAEDLDRANAAVPATVAVRAGKIRVGLEPAQIERLARSEGIWKVSRKDLSAAVALGAAGATTVSATMAAAYRAGIPVFATGGIGGVHRGAETSFDVSADLLELERTPVIVVSSGAKAILELDKTAEMLETLGIPVLGFGTREFPAFYSRESGIGLDLVVESAEEVARVYRVHRALGLEQGLLVANPVPEEHAVPRAEVERWVETALNELPGAADSMVVGKDVTPKILARLVEISGGRALETNFRLLENNIAVACRIAAVMAAGH